MRFIPSSFFSQNSSRGGTKHRQTKHTLSNQCTINKKGLMTEIQIFVFFGLNERDTVFLLALLGVWWKRVMKPGGHYGFEI